MAKKDTILTIDLNQWMTQAQKAREKGCKPQYISELIRLGKLKSWKIEALDLHLVER